MPAPPVRRTSPFVSKTAWPSFRGITEGLVALHKFDAGSQIAPVSVSPGLCSNPDTTMTRPSCRRIALCLNRPLGMAPVRDHVPVEGSYISALERYTPGGQST